MTRLLQKRILSDKKVAHLCQMLCAVVAGLVLVVGFGRLPALDLSEAQLLAACVQILFLAGVFIIIGFQCRAWRRAL